jgi:hypothetical protein
MDANTSSAQVSRRALLLGATGAGLLASGVANATPRPTGQAAWAKDAVLLRRVYTTLHPGLTRYLTAEQVGANFDAFESAMQSAQRLDDAFLALAATLSKFRCGHSYPNFYNQGKAVQDALFSGRNKLPFQFRWLGEQMVVTDPKDAAGLLARGDEILLLGAKRVADVQRALLRFVRADGHNIAKQRSLLSVRCDDAFETFDIFYALAFQRGQSGMECVARAPNGRVRRVPLEPIDLAQRRAQSPPPLAKDSPMWTIQDVPGAALLTMKSWAVYNSTWNWKGFLDEVFEDLARKATPALIIDIRANEGGLDCGDEIIARITDAPVSRSAYQRRVRYQRVPDDLLPHLSTWDDGFKDWGEAAKPRGDGYFDLIRSGDQDPPAIAPKGPRFKGKVIVLISASNSSATFNFADMIQRHRLGVLVGEATGGNRRGINGGAFFFLRLPESGLEVDVPLIATHPPTPMPDEGVTMDVAAPDTIESIAAGRDRAMEAALRLAL